MMSRLVIRSLRPILPTYVPVVNHTVSLLHFDGPDQSTAFIDETGRVWTSQNGAKIVTSNPRFGTGSASFPSASSRITCAADSALSMGSIDWCVEGFIYGAPATLPNQCVFDNRSASNAGVGIYVASNGNPRLGYTDNTGFRATAPTNFAANQWHHFAICRLGASTNNVAGYVDGVKVFATTDQRAFAPIPSISIGSDYTGAQNVTVAVDEMRVTIGDARYAGPFTPPASPFTYP